MKRSNRLFLLVGIILAVVAAVGVLLLSGGGGGQQTGQASPTPAQIDVVVAAADMPLGEVIEEGDVTTQTVSLTEAPPGALTAVSQAEGRTVREALTQGDILTDGTFGAQDSTAENVKTALAQGFRAIAVQVDQISGVGTLIRPGDRVDVVLSMTESDGKFPVAFEQDPIQSEVDEEIIIRQFADAGGNMNNTSIKVLVQNVQVLGTLLPPPPAVEQGQEATPPPDTTTAAAETETALTGREQIAILAVTPQQVELVRFAQLDGNLSLVLRAAADSTAEGEITPTTGITLRELVDTHGVIPSNIILQAPPPPLTEQP